MLVVVVVVDLVHIRQAFQDWVVLALQVFQEVMVQLVEIQILPLLVMAVLA
jgi:hypothetical protein